MASAAGFIDHRLAPAIVRLAELFDRRLQRGVSTTEDDVRFAFFVALIKVLGLEPEDITLGHGHGTITRARVDAGIAAFARRSYAIEFKYDRSIPSKKSLPTTQKAGMIFRDIFRLAQSFSPNAIEALFVYLSSREMRVYFSNPVNGFTDFFALKIGTSLVIDGSYFAQRPKTLRSVAGPVIPCIVDAILSCDLPFEHQLKVYSVRRDDGN